MTVAIIFARVLIALLMLQERSCYLRVQEFNSTHSRMRSSLAKHIVQRPPYSRKYWRSIKFGGLAVGEATVKFNPSNLSAIYVYTYYFTRARARILYVGTTAKFKSANIFISAARDQTAKFKDRQYFRLYGKFEKGASDRNSLTV